MRKITWITLISLVATVNGMAQDTTKTSTDGQVFQAGNTIIDVGASYAYYYKTLQRTEVKVGANVAKTDKSGTISALMIPIQVEYGFRNWFGFGGRFAYSSYMDTTISNTGLDLDFLLNFHLIKKGNFEMPFALFFGVSSITVKYKDALNTVAKDNGFNNGFMITPRYYFSKHFGLFANMGFVNYVYPTVGFTNSANTNTVNPATTTVSLGGQGTALGFGAIYKF